MKFKEFLEKVNPNEIVSKWINDTNVRIKTDKKLKINKSIEQFENEYLNHFLKH